MLYTNLLINPIKNLAEKNPGKIVLSSKNTRVTAKELFEQSKIIAANLRTHNFKDHDVAVLAVEPGREFLALMYGLLMLKAKIAIIDPEMGRENYSEKLNQLKPQWIFADSRLLLLDEWPMLRSFVSIFRKNIPHLNFKIRSNFVSAGMNLPLRKKHLKLKSLYLEGHLSVELKESTKSEENLIVYTSGTLAIPKGVVHSDASLDRSIQLLERIIDADENDCVGTYLPHFMLLGIASGLTVKLMGNQMEAPAKFKWFREEGINIFFGPPSELFPLILYCEANQIQMPSTLKHLMLGSAPVHKSFLDRLIRVLPAHTKITCTYGMTEHLLIAIADGRKKVMYDKDGDLLGPILNGVDVKIAEDKEILVKSEQLFKRYLHLKGREEWHATGDLGKLDEEGNLVLLGRKKEMIIRRDFNIYPALYEDTIKKIPQIHEAALIGVYDEAIHDEKVYLALETERVDFTAIKKLLSNGKHSIDKESIPDIIFSMRIPRKGRQDKIDRAAIVEYIKTNRL